jgi:hypothetical protein
LRLISICYILWLLSKHTHQNIRASTEGQKMKNPLEKLQGAIGLGIVLTILMVVVINLVHGR